MKKSLILITCMALILGLAGVAAAKSIDYVATEISPEAIFNGQSGNFRLIGSVPWSSPITFNLTFKIGTNGGTTTYPREVTFGVVNSNGDPLVYFGGGTKTSFVANFAQYSDTFTTQVKIIPPAVDGAYHVKIAPTAGTGGNKGLEPGGGILVHFRVFTPSSGGDCNPAETSLSLTPVQACVVYHATLTTFTATLTEKDAPDTPLVGKTIDFMVDTGEVFHVSTDADGKATFNY
ncbi:MAG: hypothetical protein KKD99_05005, partial [Proteobacteria bacterium]|nr:hypothetical protein [Pseudomonadota bacterium]